MNLKFISKFTMDGVPVDAPFTLGKVYQAHWEDESDDMLFVINDNQKRTLLLVGDGFTEAHFEITLD